MENPIEMDDLGENPLFSETYISTPWIRYHLFEKPEVVKTWTSSQKFLESEWNAGDT